MNIVLEPKSLYRRLNSKTVTLEEYGALKRIERLKRKIAALPRARRKNRRKNLEALLLEAEAAHAAIILSQP